MTIQKNVWPTSAWRHSKVSLRCRSWQDKTQWLTPSLDSCLIACWREHQQATQHTFPWKAKPSHHEHWVMPHWLHHACDSLSLGSDLGIRLAGEWWATGHLDGMWATASRTWLLFSGTRERFSRAPTGTHRPGRTTDICVSSKRGTQLRNLEGAFQTSAWASRLRKYRRAWKHWTACWILPTFPYKQSNP